MSLSVVAVCFFFVGIAVVGCWLVAVVVCWLCVVFVAGCSRWLLSIVLGVAFVRLDGCWLLLSGDVVC